MVTVASFSMIWRSLYNMVNTLLRSTATETFGLRSLSLVGVSARKTNLQHLILARLSGMCMLSSFENHRN